LERWALCLKKAADLVIARLEDPPQLRELAAAAAVSPYHFHRIWRVLTGETVAETTLRLRLESAEELLRQDRATVTETALAVGFATPQSLARAFRRRLGMSPRDHQRVQPLEPPARREGQPLADASDADCPYAAIST
jgi:AraC family transcriptional regulator